MTKIEQYNDIFMTTLNLNEDEATTAVYQQGNWDSVGHMALVSAVEETFGIMMDTDDIIDFSSYLKGMEILKKYDVKL